MKRLAQTSIDRSRAGNNFLHNCLNSKDQELRDLAAQVRALQDTFFVGKLVASVLAKTEPGRITTHEAIRAHAKTVLRNTLEESQRIRRSLVVLSKDWLEERERRAGKFTNDTNQGAN